jgi:hypothetical protein
MALDSFKYVLHLRSTCQFLEEARLEKNPIRSLDLNKAIESVLIRTSLQKTVQKPSPTTRSPLLAISSTPKSSATWGCSVASVIQIELRSLVIAVGSLAELSISWSRWLIPAAFSTCELRPPTIASRRLSRPTSSTCFRAAWSPIRLRLGGRPDVGKTHSSLFRVHGAQGWCLSHLSFRRRQLTQFHIFRGSPPSLTGFELCKDIFPAKWALEIQLHVVW